MNTSFTYATPSVLEGVRVLDLTQMVAGPLCTLLLGDMGADVIKVEPPGGDTARHIGRNRPCGESDYFLSMNRNKRSIVLDLKQPKDLETLRALAARADVLVENFRPGTMEKLDIGYETLKSDNPGLIYCSLSGFGSDGPYRDRPALDPVIQAMSGLMQLTGTPDSGPLKLGVLLSDFVPPLFGTIAVLGALRARDAGGLGQRIEISMLDATVFSMVPREQYFFSTGKTPERSGNAHYQMAPWNTYVTADGMHLMVVAHTEKYWRNLVQAIQIPSLSDDIRFVDNKSRMANRDALDAVLSKAFATDNLVSWTRRLSNADVLFSPVRDFVQVFSDPAVRDSMVQTVTHPTAGELPLLRSPMRMNATPVSIRSAPPLLGEHTQEILSELGIQPPSLKGE
ncbi:CoA transferase [Ottowia caeni]|uniref:CaiB/BaiF CoA transferase family protein n=1 Tax=Ottowia caeni TaxID=2870339 RepID=UPI001E3A52B4|nr:CoA transferase [Ottowia caeni]